MSVSLTMKLPDEDAKSLNLIASHFDRSKSYLALKAVKRYINEMLEQIDDEKDADEALKTWKDISQKLHNDNEVEAFINANCREG
jgi:predicted transcriptional regulator